MPAKKNTTTKKPVEKKPIDAVEQQLQETLVNSQDAEQSAIPENADNNESWKPELSPELLQMDKSQDPLAPQDSPKVAEPDLPKTQVQQAQQLANEIAGFVAATVEGVTGRSYGLSPAGVKKWSEGVAPCLVKYGLTDMGEIMSKWGVEIQAGISTATLGFGVYSAHRQYKKEELAAELKSKVDAGASNEGDPEEQAA
ncbi:hypothetical protein FLM48_11075 [Shewanella sp. Scap07]|uniref:hypothetical protein n=1 Tax=Shewanella sp. Scap07 TaxID=2589987 RepID=UPI0015C03EAD|nr:hypothetical protein [Shewanella sp. Scap07]QLE85572.1 hypothetical protein FLM48_11075 [Shewanella sp. Scap07]